MYFCKQPARETQTTLLKGTVHPKKRAILSFTHPHVIPISLFLLLKTKEDILKNVGNRKVIVRKSMRPIICPNIL